MSDENNPWKESLLLEKLLYSGYDLPLISEQNIIYAILKHDDFFNHSAVEISEFFKFHPDNAERNAFVRTIFDESYCEVLIEDDLSSEKHRYGYKAHESGLLIWKGSFLDKKAYNDLPWDYVTDCFVEMIDKEILTDKVDAQISFFDLDEPLDLTAQDKLDR